MMKNWRRSTAVIFWIEDLVDAGTYSSTTLPENAIALPTPFLASKIKKKQRSIGIGHFLLKKPEITFFSGFPVIFSVYEKARSSFLHSIVIRAAAEREFFPIGQCYICSGIDRNLKMKVHVVCFLFPRR